MAHRGCVGVKTLTTCRRGRDSRQGGSPAHCGASPMRARAGRRRSPARASAPPVHKGLGERPRGDAVAALAEQSVRRTFRAEVDGAHADVPPSRPRALARARACVRLARGGGSFSFGSARCNPRRVPAARRVATPHRATTPRRNATQHARAHVLLPSSRAPGPASPRRWGRPTRRIPTSRCPCRPT